MPSFNLVDEQWIPCLMRSGDLQPFGLRHVLLKAHDISEICDPSPPVVAALHRLLLAVLHRVFGPEHRQAWAGLWRQARWPPEPLETYFARWEARFDLFDEHRPFYQTGGLRFSRLDKNGHDRPYEVTMAKLAHELAAGDTATLFDHTNEAAAPRFSAPMAARLLVAAQSFAVGGLITFEDGQDRKLHGSADAAPLVKGAVALVRGANLFQTLMLNLCHFNYADEEPFPGDPRHDAPAWERDEPTRAEDRRPAGYLDWLTWQSRRIRLRPETDPTGGTLVRRGVIMKGNQFPGGFHRRHCETMVAFRRVERPAEDQDPWPAIAFQEDRSLWRDSLTLFQSVAEKHARPRMLDWLSDLAANGVLSPAATYSLSLSGLCVVRAKVLFWRQERLPLPLAYLGNIDLVGALEKALAVADKAARAVNWATGLLARLQHAPDESKPPNKNQKLEIGNLANHLAPARLYWSRLEVSFRLFLVALPGDKAEELGTVSYGATELPRWAEQLRRTAMAAFAEATNGLDRSARTLKAISRAERALLAGLREVLADILPKEKEVAHGQAG